MHIVFNFWLSVSYSWYQFCSMKVCDGGGGAEKLRTYEREIGTDCEFGTWNLITLLLRTCAHFWYQNLLGLMYCINTHFPPAHSFWSNFILGVFYGHIIVINNILWVLVCVCGFSLLWEDAHLISLFLLEGGRERERGGRGYGEQLLTR